MSSSPGTPSPDPTARFSGRAESYAAGRPGYPAQVAEMLARELKLPAGATIVDLGSGTGLSSLLFLQAGFRVVGVEPNAPMRAQAEEALASYPGFVSVDGQAGATGLPSASADCVVAAQAFHWFDAKAARREVLRILRHPARAALIWNVRRCHESEFARGYERLLGEFGRDYEQVRDRHGEGSGIETFFGGPQRWRRTDFEHATPLDFELLAARTASASYLPAPGDPQFAPMMQALRRLFDSTQRDGHVVMQYDARVYYGRLDGREP